MIFKPSGFRVFDLVDDATGEEGGGFLAVRVEVERHQSVGPHGEVVVHGQNLRRRCRALLSVATQTHRVHSQAKGDATGQTHLWLPEVDAFRGHLHFPPENDGRDLKQEQKIQKQS